MVSKRLKAASLATELPGFDPHNLRTFHHIRSHSLCDIFIHTNIRDWCVRPSRNWLP